jgi:hypothetical protein
MATQSDKRPSTVDTPLNGPDVPVEDKQPQLEGRKPADRQEGMLEAQDVDELGTLTPTDLYEGQLEAGVDDDSPNDVERIELLTELELRDGETDDAYEAAEEGLAYVPPIDPPTVPSPEGDNADTVVASGMGLSALDEPYDEDHHSSALPGDDHITALVRAALLADSSTTEFARRIRIATRNSVVILRGTVEDLDDSDNAIAVAQYVEGVTEVIDELRIRALG